MLNNMNKRNWLISAIGLCLLVIGCEGGTDGGDETLSTFDADGSNGTLRIDVKNLRPSVGDRVGFFVTVLNADGSPSEFTRVACDTEQGISILEPSDNGVAFASTDSNGVMSGVLGALLPGSYILECRAPLGSGLRERVQLVNVGTTPAGFTGFPGAAGGNLGGGAIVDPSTVEGNGLSITGFLTQDASDGFQVFGPLDLTLSTNDCNGDGTLDDPEPFTFVNARIVLSNNSDQSATVTGYSVTIQQPTPAQVATNTDPTGGGFQPLQVNANSTANLDFFLAEATSNYAGSTVAPTEGVFRVDIVVSFVDSLGDSFTTSSTAQIEWDFVNNCP